MADISQIKLPDNNTYNFKDTVARGVKMYYGICTTAAATAAKVVTVGADQDFKLTVGALVMVKFTISNSASSVTLNVNSTGAKSIYYNNAVYTGTSTSVCGYANAHFIYMYDGTNWVWVGHGSDSNTTYSAMSVAEGQTATATSARTMRSDYLKQIIQYHAVPAGQGVPAGGTAGQVLAKVDGTDYNTEWITPSGGDLPEWEEVAVNATVTVPTEDVCWHITGGRTPSTSLKEILPFLYTQGRSDTLDAHGEIYYIRKYYGENTYIERAIFVPVDTTKAIMVVYKDSVEGKWRFDDEVGMWDVTATYAVPSSDASVGFTSTLTTNYDVNCVYWALYILDQSLGYCNLKVKYTIQATTDVSYEPTAYLFVSDIHPERYTTGGMKFHLRTSTIVLMPLVVSTNPNTVFHTLTLGIEINTSSSYISPALNMRGVFRHT